MISFSPVVDLQSIKTLLLFSSNTLVYKEDSMNRDQIDNAADPLADFLETPTDVPKQLINLNGQCSPAVLAGVLGINVQQVYQFRQDGKLPPNSDASFRDCIKWHTTFWKTKSISKANSMGEAALIQKIKLDTAKTEQTWLAIKKDRGELIDVKMLAEQFEHHFIHMRMQLCAISRRLPALEKDIDGILLEWSKLGTGIMKKSQEELDNFIQAQMEKEVEIVEAKADE